MAVTFSKSKPVNSVTIPDGFDVGTIKRFLRLITGTSKDFVFLNVDASGVPVTMRVNSRTGEITEL